MLQLVPKWKTKTWPWNFRYQIGNKPAHEHFYKLDIVRVSEWLGLTEIKPLQITNFIIKKTKYISDEEKYGVDEKIPKDVQDVHFIMNTGGDDCDGLAILTASVFHTMGDPNIRLCSGSYGFGEGLPNHVWCAYHDEEQPGNPYLIEVTGNTEFASLPRLRMKPLYKTHFFCDANDNYWEFV